MDHKLTRHLDWSLERHMSNHLRPVGQNQPMAEPKLLMNQQRSREESMTSFPNLSDSTELLEYKESSLCKVKCFYNVTTHFQFYCIALYCIVCIVCIVCIFCIQASIVSKNCKKLVHLFERTGLA